MKRILAFFNNPIKAVAFFTVLALVEVALLDYVAPGFVWIAPVLYALCLIAIAIEDLRRYNHENHAE